VHIFVPYAFPASLAIFEIIKKRKKFAISVTVYIHSESGDSVVGIVTG
jgi:hypothetical protein